MAKKKYEQRAHTTNEITGIDWYHETDRFIPVAEIGANIMAKKGSVEWTQAFLHEMDNILSAEGLRVV